ncbi:pyrroloquinoline quinone biosynthesis protein PqqB [Cohnella fermenti]|nr:pyrroloquinoline quinone biosynthesis protein PqqB [Cohnella fermenti]
MFIKVLGSAAGGGCPQWNCGCSNCRRIRDQDPAVSARRNDSLAISPDGARWALLNAGPDVCLQTESHAALRPNPATLRGSPVEAVLLTDAELDHTTGLLQLRQGSAIAVYATSPVLGALEGDFPVRRIVEPFASFAWQETRVEESFPLFGGQLSVCPFLLGDKPPRYVDSGNGRPSYKESAAWVVGYRVTDRRTGGTIVYAPGIEIWTRTLERHLADADCVLVDGTFWRGDELILLGVSELDAADMGHLPAGGPNGSAERLSLVRARRKVYIHINNTNPMLAQDSPERQAVERLGIEIGVDGMEMEV